LRRHEQAVWRRGQLLDAALTVFGRKGVHVATLREVADAAGVTPGLLHHYFGSKEALVLAVISERGFRPELRRLLDQADGRPAAVVLPEVLAKFGKVLAQRQDLLNMFFSLVPGEASVEEDVCAFAAEGREPLAEYLAARVAAGELRPHDTNTAAQVLFSTCVLARLSGLVVDPVAVSNIVLSGLSNQLENSLGWCGKMTSTLWLLLAATLLNGLLAGASMDQSIKQLPARHTIGVEAYSEYSKAGDLGNGIALYATLGIGGAALALIAAGVAFTGKADTNSQVALTVLIVLTIAHSVMTTQAAPTNFSQRKAVGDPVRLEAVFRRFEKLQTVRATLQFLTPLAAAWAFASFI
jgi:AcrR family transcriptional regulator